MAELDDTDAQILHLLMEDARRSFTDIGDRVGLSAPSVSNRVDRLVDLGVVDGFTVDVDRSLLVTGDELLIDIETPPGGTGAVVETLRDLESVESVVETFDLRVTVHAHMDDRELERLFGETLDESLVEDYEVRKVKGAVRKPQVGHGDLAIECVQCGKPIEDEGVTVTVDDRRYYLCCTSCESLFTEQYEKLQDGAEG